MEFFNYGVVRARVQRETDTEEESTIQPDELVDFGNKGIDIVEAEILKIDEDYYLDFADIALVSGTADYVLPANIYANKIRAVIYQDGSTIYPIKKLRRKDKFLKLALSDQFNTGSLSLRFYIRNRATSSPRIVFTPVPTVSGSFPRVWFIRAATRIPLVSAGTQAASDAIDVDVMEFVSVVEAYMKMKIMFKEGDPRYPDAAIEFEALRKQMVETLSEMIPDDDTEMEQDLSFYEGHV